MPFTMKYAIETRYLTKPSKRRSGQVIAPKVVFVVAHDTGNINSTAGNNVAYYERSRDEESASAHIFVDDKQIIECIPALQTSPPEKAWHVLYSVDTDNVLFGYNANDAAIGIEYCFGDRIDADETYRKYVWTIAYTCFKFGLEPAKSVVGHFFLDPRRKTDPVTGLAHSRRSYEQLLRDVPAEYAACTGGPAPVPPTPPASGTVTATVALNIRVGAASTRARIYQTVASGTELPYVGTEPNGEAVNGNPLWYRDTNGNYFWSGGTR